MRVNDLVDEVKNLNPFKHYGRVTQVVGLMIESKGPKVSVGEVCHILVGKPPYRKIMVEVVGFREEKVLLMPFDRIEQIAPGSLVEATNKPLQIKIGSSLIGNIIDGLGRSFEGKDLGNGLTSFPTDNPPPNPLSRPRITEPLSLGVRAIDGLFTVGKGQRI